jgi:hypothetical protein
VRDEAKGKKLTEEISGLRTVIGDLGSLDILEKEARESDIVICRSSFSLEGANISMIILILKWQNSDTAPDVGNSAAIEALLKGLEDPKRQKKGHYIHTSGAMLIVGGPDGSKPGSKIWDDVVDIDTITSMPDTAFHRKEEKVTY